jgi:Putative DNA-binding domain
MSDPAAFQQSFGAALAGDDNQWLNDPYVARALTIHRNTSTRAIIDALGDNYPVIRQLVGEEPFAACAAEFVDALPATDPRLCLYGKGFSDFLAAYAPFSELPYLPDIAALERLCTRSLFAADAVRFVGTMFDMERPLPLHPATYFVRFESPAVAIWQAHQPDADPDAIEAVEWERCAALVTRNDVVLVSALDDPSALFVENCNENRPLGEAAVTALEAGGDLSAIFASLILCGAFQNQASKEDPQ